MLAAGLDDALMNITHIVRGEDLIAATPRQLLLREAVDIHDAPVFAHLPLLVSEDGRPLSKRWGDVSVRAYRDRGFLPEAMVNYLALLGWSYDDKTTLFTMDQLVEHFSLERVGRNPAAFDVAKLEWLNGYYIRGRAPEVLAEELVPFCERAGLPADTEEGRAILKAVAPLLVERLRRLEEAPSMIAFLFRDVVPDEKTARALEGQAQYLAEVAGVLDATPEWTAEAIEAALRELAATHDLKPRKAFQPLRAAVTGTLISPPLFESMEILGRDATLRRIRAATA